MEMTKLLVPQVAYDLFKVKFLICLGQPPLFTLMGRCRAILNFKIELQKYFSAEKMSILLKN